MLTGDGNEKCKKINISLPLFCTTSTYAKLPSCTFYGGKVVHVPTFHFFFSLQLILTLLAASIVIFSSQL